ncbi:MAG: alpha/beta hydrolase fold protein, partial [Ilumatobacteraceae bacterium]|nr:alpha/beta hydrolase fold protein [Ilumatobacteraceae bacterium]
MTTPTDRLTRVVTRAAMRHADALSRSSWYAPAMESLVETQSLLAGQRRLGQDVVQVVGGPTTTRQRRRAREMADRRALDPARAALPGAPAVWWHEGGRGAATAPTILLINGWTASGLMWPAAFVGRLEATRRVLRVDNRGTGYSRTAPAPYTIRAMADDAAAVLHAAGAVRAVVVGVSMGGMIAQELALRHPALVSGLVLAGTRPPGPAHLPAAPAVLRRVFAERQPGETLEHTIGTLWTSFCAPGFGETHPELVDELVGQVVARMTPAAAVNTQMRAIAAWYGPGRLRASACPTVVVHGDQDRLMPVGNGMRLA